MLHAVIWIISIVSYAFAIHLGVSEGLAKLVLLVVLAETFISWACTAEISNPLKNKIVVKNTYFGNMLFFPNFD